MLPICSARLNLLLSSQNLQHHLPTLQFNFDCGFGFMSICNFITCGVMTSITSCEITRANIRVLMGTDFCLIKPEGKRSCSGPSCPIAPPPPAAVLRAADGFIDFLEFIAAINLVIRGKIDQKLKWYFKLYDADGNGTIDKRELLSIFTAIQAINGNQELTPEEFTNMVFQKIDVNNDGELSLEEFISGVESDENLLEMISKSFDLSNVLKIIQSGRRHSV
ncbi:cyclase-activating 3 [Podarcis lilfordi]|uniref:Cyclase-activating 3 n=1 Tax=Podarcis lilfordi TaxID=74358 RepID=A0AA35K8U8_9SAUR|nr:cyclase-activating 3 [Podarcis lilfordi]